eukprot:6151470-Prorocentrum_lima.AAC.1
MAWMHGCSGQHLNWGVLFVDVKSAFDSVFTPLLTGQPLQPDAYQCLADEQGLTLQQRERLERRFASLPGILQSRQVSHSFIQLISAVFQQAWIMHTDVPGNDDATPSELIRLTRGLRQGCPMAVA